MFLLTINIRFIIILLISVKEVQRKWKSLRTLFAREQSRRKNIKSGSRQSSWKTYVFYNQLSFLGPSTTNKLTASNVSPTRHG